MARELLIQDGKLTSDLDADHKTIKNLEGFAALDESGKVPASQLPSYVDDVLEFPATTDFPATGETGKIYVATSTGKVYRWSGSQYIEIANPDLSGYVNGGSYDSTSKKILLKHDSSTIAEIDATAFVKDGMVSSVEIDDGKLVITFNTDAGQEPIEIPLTDIFDPADYYDKDAVDGLLDDKVDVVEGKGLSTEDYTTAEKQKLAGIAAGAEVNVIETVKVNGTALTPSSKAVDITLPTIPTPVAPASATASGQFADALATKSELAAKVALEEFSSGSWAQGSSYLSGSIVFYDGFLYLCSLDVSSSSTPPSEDPTHWDQVAVNYLMFLKADRSDIPSPSSTTPSMDGTAAVGVSDDYARADHVHPSDTSKADASSLATVATTGSYDDLSDKPTIPTVPTNVSAFTNDAGYLTAHQSWNDVKPSGGITASDLASAVQTSLGKADTALQQQDITGKADAAALRYDLPTNATAIDTASQETVEGETVNYGAATLADRTGNRVSITAALDELRVTFPPAVSGKLRDFGLRVEVGTGSAALTAPALVPVAPTGETIKLENNAKQIPALADGTATAKGVTLLYFSESAPGVFFAKGEQVEEVA